MSALTRRIPRPSAALVVGSVALFASLGGTSYAALQITGANVANSTLTGADVMNKSLGPQELKPNSIGGSRIKEGSLGIVPKAEHAVAADGATSAQTAAKAADADAVGGIPASALMTKKPRAFEATIPAHANFPNGSTLGTLADLQPGDYVVTARLTYDNPGAAGAETCSLHVPGADDVSTFAPGAAEAETVTLQEAVSSNAVFSPSVSCSADGNDDTLGSGSIIAVRLD